MRRPPALKKGDVIQIVAPSRWIDEKLLEFSLDFLSALEYRPRYSKTLLGRHGQFAGTDDLRRKDIVAAWRSDEVKALWVARGGYGAQRIVDGLVEHLNPADPKWLIGFSDTTALHGLLNNSGVCSLHAPLLSTLSNTHREDIEELLKILSGGTPSEISFHFNPLNIKGEARGHLIGGNLSVLHSMIATSSMPSFDGAILFIEDVDEMLYHLDRMMMHLKRIGLLESLAGVLVGGLTEIKDNIVDHGFSVNNPYGKSALEIISLHLKGLDVPVAFGMPCGHGDRNHPLLLGSEVFLKVDSSSSKLNYL
ncbi:MAG: LD-carboxypeptidase [Flavobacteriales bacterium]|nr:LD-carboxypeptidase [Flavobacteriales bacterium]